LHDLPYIREVSIPHAARYADNLVYATADVIGGIRARQRATDRLQPAGLSLRGPGEPVNLQHGGTIEFLGMILRLQDDTVSYALADDALADLGDHLEEAHLTPNPTQTGRMAVLGWVRAMGPTLESSAAKTVPPILKLCTDHGHQGLLHPQDILAAWEASHRAWLDVRKHAYRASEL
jgi:hypothetical protein